MRQARQFTLALGLIGLLSSAVLAADLRGKGGSGCDGRCHAKSGACADGCGHQGLLHGRCSRCKKHHQTFEGQDPWYSCGCNGSYKFPVPPLSTYHWPGMYAHRLMTDRHSPWRFPPIKSFGDEAPKVESVQLQPLGTFKTVKKKPVRIQRVVTPRRVTASKPVTDGKPSTAPARSSSRRVSTIKLQRHVQ